MNVVMQMAGLLPYNDGRECAMPDVQNFHLPLPDAVYRQLRQEADRRRVPATALAREAVEAWLDKAQREVLHSEIAKYAKEHAGSQVDLDQQLEAAGVEMLKDSRSGTKSRRKARKR